ncbi:MAG: cytochrome c oxidase subunit II [Gammaproteobacteria bacterium]|jgi:cytochrome c oxidase subunit 2|nr:cytochrome c oxidase subunit II [Gammaproteobacteria bacterium]MBK9470347.1 cytochrome c oxidase subunit II [Gammaproteobacteria bacterium]MBP6479526.1 cytochrome c oxidase subunit II [Pseudomonadales bacterium]MBP7910684.1 cytochrome c oxidase subunit II [Pseudomonadales bacterium]
MRAATRRRLLPLALPGATLSAFSGSLLAAEAGHSSVNMTRGVTEVSHAIYDLHMYTLWVCVAIGVVVFGVMFYSIFAHRKSKGAVAAHFHESTTLEIAWTVVPFLILATFAAPATRTLLSIYNADEADLDVMITGYQWKWKYEYLDKGVSFFSALSTSPNEFNNINNPDQAPKGEHYLLEVDEPLVIPAGKKVRFLVTAADVIHSWWVPQLAVKKDAIPGFVNETWTRVPEPGIYRGQCAELCGKDHGFMPIVVNVLPEAEFDGWLAKRKEEADAEKALMAQTFTMDELMARGESVYNKACASCHQPNGEGVPPAFPALKGSAIAMGPVDGHLDIVVNGKQGTAMAAFGAQLNEVDLAAVITYERNAWGNNMGDMLQPIDVAKFKKAK